MIKAKVLDLTDCPEKGIIFFDRESTRLDDLVEALNGTLKETDNPGGHWVIPCDMSKPLPIILAESDLNTMGWFYQSTNP